MWIDELTSSIGIFMKKKIVLTILSCKKIKTVLFLIKKMLIGSLVDSSTHSGLTGSTL
jgi:hypothetical protein